MPDQAPPRLDHSETRKISANFCSLRHTNEEFIIDVGMSLIVPDDVPKIDASLIITPFMAKRLWSSLGAVVASYESIFGNIEIDAESRVIPQPPTPFETATAPLPVAPELPLPVIPAPAKPANQFVRPKDWSVLDGPDILDSTDSIDVISGLNSSPCIPAEFPEFPDD